MDRQQRVIQLDDPEPAPPVPCSTSPPQCPECNGRGYWISEETEDYADDCAACGGTGINDIRLRRREDDWCPVCEAWPRITDPAKPPHDPYTHRRCLTCDQTWLDHHDHTPD